MDGKAAGNRLRFGLFELNRDTLELSRKGRRVPLQALPARLLLMMAERAGEMVSREEIEAQLWPEGTFVDFEAGLNTAVRKIRQALDDSAQNPRFVETVPRRGLRFLASVEKEEANGGGEIRPVAAPSSPVMAEPEAKRWNLGNRRVLALGAAALAVVGTIAFVARGRFEPNREAGLRIEPLTSFPNEEYQGSFSPGGREFVFSWSGYEGTSTHLYVGQTGSGNVRAITSGAVRDELASWSPDGKWIAFVRDIHRLTLVSPQGGPTREIGETLWVQLSWTPDSSEVISTRKRKDSDLCDLEATSISTGERKALNEASDPVPCESDASLGFSPDHRYFGFTKRPDPTGAPEIYVRPAGGGRSRRLTYFNREILGWTWVPGTDEIVFSSNRGGPFNLYRVSVNGARDPEAMYLPGQDVRFPFAVRDREGALLLGFENWQLTMNIRETRLDEEAGRKSRLVAPSTRVDINARLSPDGQKVAFISNRSGYYELWTAPVEGGDPAVLTNLGPKGGYPESPSWSPDGRRIAMTVRQTWRGPLSSVHLVAVDGGSMRTLIDWRALHAWPSWSRDGNWIYFGSSRESRGTPQIWKTPEGGPKNQAIQITRGGGAEAQESPDGKTLYFTRSELGEGLWKMPAGDADDRRAELAIRDTVTTGWWWVAGRGVYYMDIRMRGNGPTASKAPKPVFLYDGSTGKTERVAELDGHVIPWQADFFVTPDGRRAIYSEMNGENIDLMLARGLR